MSTSVDLKSLTAEQLKEATSSTWQKLSNILTCSEWCLIEMMKSEGLWPAPLPTASPPADYETAGSIEYGLFLFWLKNPVTPYLNLNAITQNMTPDEYKLFYGLLLGAEYEFGGIDSYMTEAAWKVLSTTGAIGPDGSFVGTETWQLYDQNWIVALFNMVLTDTNPSYFNGGTLTVPPIPYEPVKIKGEPGSRQIKIGLLSDWGTGSSTAVQVMALLKDAKADCIIHLGDVYYSGSPQSQAFGYFQTSEEQNFLMNLWPEGYEGKSFLLNSNHEMYCGAQGLFNDALMADSASMQRNTPFYAQNGCSMFALKVGDWTLLGLDSAFNGSSENLFMTGNLGLETDGDNHTQIQWIKSLKLDPKKTIVLTHHTGFDFDCSPSTQSLFAPFWEQVREALGRDPYAWYWGHTHNGIVYTKPVTISSGFEAPPLFTTETYCRCLGHGALPFGVASGLTQGNKNIPNVEWFASNKMPSEDGRNQVYNGCVGLGFVVDDDNNVESITEFFISIDPDPVPFVKRIYGAAPDPADSVKFGWPGEDWVAI